MHKDYLGDGVYAEVEQGMVRLSTNNGYGDHAVIFLEPEVFAALTRWWERVRRLEQQKQKDNETERD